VRGIPTFPQLRRRLVKLLHRTYHVLQKADILTCYEHIRTLLAALDFREFVMVFLAITTGLRLSELFALQWQDIDFATLRVKVNRSIVKQRVGSCKTEASQDAVPLPARTAEVLLRWQARAIYSNQFDWIFASSHTQGKRPYWGAPIMRKKIKPIAQKCGITRLQGWHTFRHTYASLLNELGTGSGGIPAHPLAGIELL